MVGAFFRNLLGGNKQPLQSFSGGSKSLPKIYSANVQSWNPETHPEGMGDSQLVQDIDYTRGDGTLDVTYRDGYTARYSDVPPEEVKEFTQSDSKGRWALAHLWDKPYVGVK